MTWARFMRLQIWGQALIGVAVFHLWLRGDWLNLIWSCNALVIRLRLADAHGGGAAFWRCCRF